MKPSARKKPAVNRPLPSANDLYDRHPGEISVLLGWFFLRHLNEIYQKFQGDLLLAIVLGEVAHHNICHHFSSGRPKSSSWAEEWNRDGAGMTLQSCSAHSLSLATGIPRETCRRKLAQIQKLGWVARHPDGGYVIERDVGKHFVDTNRKTLADLLDVVEALHRLPR